MNIRCLHQDAVAYNAAFPHMHATEQHTVFNRAFHNTAVRHQAVAHGGMLAVARGRFILNLGVNGMLAVEQILPHRAVKHSHIDGARQAAGEAQVLLSRFRTELADVQVSAQLCIDVGELATFCDYVFDGFFSDWVVQSRIQDAQAGVAATAGQVDALLARLEGTRSHTRQRLASLENELRSRTEGA